MAYEEEEKKVSYCVCKTYGLNFTQTCLYYPSFLGERQWIYHLLLGVTKKKKKSNQ